MQSLQSMGELWGFIQSIPVLTTLFLACSHRRRKWVRRIFFVFFGRNRRNKTKEKRKAFVLKEDISYFCFFNGDEKNK